MRERKANEKAIQKTIEFLKNVKHSIETTGAVQLTTICKTYRINASTVATVRDLKIAYQEDDKWVFKGNADRKTALLILDYNLNKNKQWTNPAIIPDTERLISILGDVSEKLSISINQQNIALNRTKTATNRDTENLFTKQDQDRRDLVYLAGCVATVLWEDKDRHMDEINDGVVDIAKDLLNKINSISLTQQ